MKVSSRAARNQADALALWNGCGAVMRAAQWHETGVKNDEGRSSGVIKEMSRAKGAGNRGWFSGGGDEGVPSQSLRGSVRPEHCMGQG